MNPTDHEKFEEILKSLVEQLASEQGNIIDESLLVTVLPKNIATLLQHTKNPKEKQKLYGKVEKLNLEHKNLDKLQGLWMMRNLLTLNVSNNKIVYIENLGKLRYLKELHLSNNRLKKIQGLTTLTQLKKLNLRYNEISEIEGLEQMAALEVLNVANNKIESVETFRYMRNIKTLSTLNILGNPVCEQVSKNFVFAMVPQLLSYNYLPISDHDRKHAEEEYADDVRDVQLTELMEQRDNEKILAENQRIEKQKKAFVTPLEGDYLFEKIFENDPAGQAMLKLLRFSTSLGDSVKEIYNQFKNEFSQTATCLYDYGMNQQILRAKEIEKFENIFNDEKKKAILLFRDDLEKCAAQRTEITKKMIEMGENFNKGEIERMIENVKNKCRTTARSIYFGEYRLNRNLNEFLKTFKRNMKEIDFNFTIEIVSNFELLRKSATTFNTQIAKLLRANLKKNKNQNVYKSVPDLYSILAVEDKMEDAIMNSFGELMDVLYAQEDELNDSIVKYLDNLCDVLENEEARRHKLVFIQTDSYLKSILDDLVIMKEEIHKNHEKSLKLTSLNGTRNTGLLNKIENYLYRC